MAKQFTCNWNGTGLINSSPPVGEDAFTTTAGEAANVWEKRTDGLGWNGDTNYAYLNSRLSGKTCIISTLSGQETSGRFMIKVSTLGMDSLEQTIICKLLASSTAQFDLYLKNNAGTPQLWANTRNKATNNLEACGSPINIETGKYYQIEVSYKRNAANGASFKVWSEDGKTQIGATQTCSFTTKEGTDLTVRSMGSYTSVSGSNNLIRYSRFEWWDTQAFRGPLVLPEITDSDPVEGIEGTEITITGTGFKATQGTGGVTIGGSAATITSWSDTEIVCEAPAGTPGAEDIVVTNSDGFSDTLSGGFIYLTEPSITNIDPVSGPDTGGTEITITGTGFLAAQGSGGVTVGGVAASITSWSDTEIVCDTPAGSLGAKDVIVTNDDALSDTDAGGFTYLATPSIDDIDPVSGTSAGGTEITISGTGFQANQGSGSVKIGGSAASITSWSDTEIVCDTPSGTIGAKNVVVENDNGYTDTATGGFTYLTPVALTDIDPATGPSVGGTEVTITGTGFLANQGTGSAHLGGNDITITSWSDTEIVGNAPAHDPATVGLVVVNNDGLSDTLEDAFVFTGIAPQPVGQSQLGIQNSISISI